MKSGSDNSSVVEAWRAERGVRQRAAHQFPASVMVTGASGFIGRRLAATLAAGQPDCALTCLAKAGDDAFGRSGVEFLRARLITPIFSDLSAGSPLPRQRAADVLFHLAANTHTWERDHTCNDKGTDSLLRALGGIGPRTHVVFTSTTAVMDNRPDFREPLRASSLFRSPPMSRYGQSKWRAEQFLKGEARRLGFRLSIVRLCTVYGTQPRPNTLFEVLKREVENQSIASRLNWPALTSFIHVDDVVDCLLRIADKPPEPGQTRVYLLASESKTLTDVSRLLHAVQGRTYRAIKLPEGLWRLARSANFLSRWLGHLLPALLSNAIWRFNMVVNPVFNCDTEPTRRLCPDLRLRRIEDCIGEI